MNNLEYQFELHNLCERFVIMCQDMITVSDLPEDIMDSVESASPKQSMHILQAIAAPSVDSAPSQSEDTCAEDDFLKKLSYIEPGSVTLREFRGMAEHAFIQATMKICGQNVSRAADMLGIERTNLHKKIKKYETNGGVEDDD